MKTPDFLPKPARAMNEIGIPRPLVADLVLKRTFLEGTTSLSSLTAETKLDYNVVHELYTSMLKDQLVETKRVIGHNYEFTLTVKGLQVAQEAYRKSRYVGPAPVSLAEYRRMVAQQAFKPDITLESISSQFSDLVLTEDILRSLGGALMTGWPIFIYGPTGNGKSSIAERLKRIYTDYVYIPYAVEVSSQVLSIFDPVTHQPADEQPQQIDPRWILCHRPFLSVGGELRADMLEPHVDQNQHIVRAPLQMKANNGILVIDDFGRQRMQPRELLNRWIVPLDRRVDYISWFGATIEIPFELIVVFATNMDVSSLAEEAFIRRIKNKIKIDNISESTFLEILQRECGLHGVDCSPVVADYALRECLGRSKGGLRGCFPKDLLDIIVGIAAFDRKSPQFDAGHVDRAIRMYFTV